MMYCRINEQYSVSEITFSTIAGLVLLYHQAREDP
jgi:hypothetical protein